MNKTVISINLFEIAIGLIIIWAIFPITVALWIKICLSAFFIIDGCGQIPTIILYLQDIPLSEINSVTNKGDNENGKNENNSNQ